jgi:hypothetical protein
MARRRDHASRSAQPSGVLEWLGATVGAPFKLVRKKAREKVRPVVPALSFGDVVGLVVHDWEGAHGKARTGRSSRWRASASAPSATSG